mgnify:CR=1 FL=1
MKKYLIIVAFLMFAFCIYTIEYEQNQLVDTPTAGILQKGNVEINTKIYK